MLPVSQPVWIPNEHSSRFFLMCTPDYHPSSPTRFKRSKAVKVKKFPLFKNWTKPLYFDVDILRQLLDPSDPLQNTESQPFKTFFFFLNPYYALPPAIQFHLANTFSLNTCATVITYSLLSIFQRNLLPPSFGTSPSKTSTLNVEEPGFSEMLVPIYQTIQRHRSEDKSLFMTSYCDSRTAERMQGQSVTT